MITLRESGARGQADYGWLDSRHSFSFGEYHDPAHMGFQALRVINEDRVLGGQGFPPHPHRDMEIITYVLKGGLAHKDSMGNTSVIKAGEVQRMSAGTGVVHSEYNASNDEKVHFFQIWIQPDKAGLPPGYDQKLYPEADKRGRLLPVASHDGREGSLKVHQNVVLYATVLEAGQALTHALSSGRHAWVQVARGSVTVSGTALAAEEGTVLAEGDGAALSGEEGVKLEAAEETELLLFDLG